PPARERARDEHARRLAHRDAGQKRRPDRVHGHVARRHLRCSHAGAHRVERGERQHLEPEVEPRREPQPEQPAEALLDGHARRTRTRMTSITVSSSASLTLVAQAAPFTPSAGSPSSPWMSAHARTALTTLPAIPISIGLRASPSPCRYWMSAASAQVAAAPVV